MSRTILAARRVGSAIVAPETIYGANLKGTWDHRVAYDANGTSSFWDDQSAVAGNFIQNDGANHPSEVSVGGVAGGAAFNGTSQYMTDNIGAMSNRITAGAFGIAYVLTSPASIPTESTPNTDGPVVADSGGYLGLTVTTTPRAFVFDGAYKNTAAASLAPSTLVAGLVWHDGVTLKHKMTGSTEKTVAAGNVGSLAAALRLGRPWSGALRGKMDLGLLHVMNVTPNGTQRTQHDDWINSTRGVRFTT